MQEKLTRMRGLLGLSFNKMAKILNVSNTMVYLWESGRFPLNNSRVLSLIEEFEKLETVNDLEEFKKGLLDT